MSLVKSPSHREPRGAIRQLACRAAPPAFFSVPRDAEHGTPFSELLFLPASCPGAEAPFCPW